MRTGLLFSQQTESVAKGELAVCINAALSVLIIFDGYKGPNDGGNWKLVFGSERCDFYFF